MQELYGEAKKLIDVAKNILIISHKKPDADTLGSAICLRIWLKDIGKEVVLSCIDKPSSTFNFLPYLDEFVDEFDSNKFDLIIVVDAGANYMTGFHTKYENLFKSKVPVLNIDHHASNDKYGTINIVEPEVASTTVILYKMLNAWNVDINNKMATCLLSGIYGDTGSFMHSNTSGAIFEIASDLMNMGAHVSTVSKNLFGNKSISTLRLWGRALENAYVTEDNVVMSIVKEEDYREIKAKPEDLSGVIDYLNMVPKTKFAVLINDDRKGHIKGSFRTRNDDVDLSKVAAQYGGGGHPKASGFSIPGKLQAEVTYKIVTTDNVRKHLDFSR